MEFPEEQYYRLNRIFLSLIGFWPYENFNIRQTKVILSLLMYITFIGAQLMKLYISEYNFDLALEVMCYVLFITVWSTKYIAFYAIIENLKKFRNCVRNNWSVLIDDQEIHIMRKYASVGRMFTVLIALCVYVGILSFLLTQYIPNLLDIIMPLNESRPRTLAVLAEYFIDQQKYFHILAMHINIALFVTVTTGVATETFSLANAIHAFGMFKIARFSELLKANFGVSYLLVFTIALGSASINLYHVFYMITMGQETLEIIKFAIFTFFHFLFIIAGNFAGQEFINSDSQVYQTLCSTQWYNAPIKIQKMISFLIQKTTKTYKVDAGGMFSPCFEGLASAMSLLLSFFTVLGSVQ